MLQFVSKLPKCASVSILLEGLWFAIIALRRIVEFVMGGERIVGESFAVGGPIRC